MFRNLKYKLRSIRKIMKADHAAVFTLNDDTQNQFDAEGWGSDDIEPMFLLCVSLIESTQSMSKIMTKIATETGELHALKEMKKALDKLEKNNGRK